MHKLKRIQKIVIKEIGKIAEREVRLGDRLEDLSLDSIEFVELEANIEYKLGVDIFDDVKMDYGSGIDELPSHEKIEKYKLTVREYIDYVLDRLKSTMSCKKHQ